MGRNIPLARLRAAGLKLIASGNTLNAGPRAALTDELRALIVANKPAILEALAQEEADRIYARGLQLLATMLADEAFIPKPTVDSLRKYFPSIVGPRPFWIPAEEWPGRQAHFRGLIERLGQTGIPPDALIRSVRRNENAACDVSGVEENKKAPRAQWYQETRAWWTRLKRETRRKRPRKVKPPVTAPAVIEPLAPSLPIVPSRALSIDLERRAKVEQQLRDHPGQRLAFDVVNAPARPEPGEPVSVVRAVRQGDHIIVVDELLIPRDWFDPMRFLLTIDPAGALK